MKRELWRLYRLIWAGIWYVKPQRSAVLHVFAAISSEGAGRPGLESCRFMLCRPGHTKENGRPAERAAVTLTGEDSENLIRHWWIDIGFWGYPPSCQWAAVAAGHVASFMTKESEGTKASVALGKKNAPI